MGAEVPILIAQPGLGQQDFLQLSLHMQEHYGIQLPLSKLKMVEARLQKRVKALAKQDFTEYFDYTFSSTGAQEYLTMVDLLTTNKTDFFREPAHFEFLRDVVLPAYLQTRSERPFKIWSAACSTGEEVYTLAMVLEEFLLRTGRSFHYQLTGSDLSMQVLQRALRAVYQEVRIESIPMTLRKRYFLRSTREQGLVRIKPQLLKSIQFKQINLLKPIAGIENSLDVIFCRNVLIYFNRKDQSYAVSQLLSNLKKGGYLFIGHAESLTNMDLPIVQVKPTVYQKI